LVRAEVARDWMSLAFSSSWALTEAESVMALAMMATSTAFSEANENQR